MTELRKLLLSLPGRFAFLIGGRKLGRFRPLILLYGFFYHFLRPRGLILIVTQGSRMYVASHDVGVTPYLLEWGTYEQYETALFRRLVCEGMVVVDVGANIGYYTLLAAQLVGAQGRVFAFEPDPYNYGMLCKNIELNKYRNVVPVEKAVFAESGKRQLFLDKRNLGGHSLSAANVGEGGVLMVEATSLDDYFENSNCKIDVVKIDVQGSELDVLEGMRKTIDRCGSLKIITEFWPVGLRNCGHDPRAFLERLIELGFRLYLVGERVELVSVSTLLESCCDGKSATLLCRKFT